jgi:parallel beta-helix repeat protein
VKVPEDVPQNPTIQEGIRRARPGDTVSVWGYGEPPFIYYENDDYMGKPIYVVNRSYIEEIPGYPPSPEWVIIDGCNRATTVTIQNVIGWAVLQGFTIRNGYDYYGGGVALINNGHSGSPPNNIPCVIDNFIINNRAVIAGGGVYGRYGCGQISRNIIRRNTVGPSEPQPPCGGGIGIQTSDYPFPYLITDNVIDSNTCEGLAYFGGGIGLNGAVPKINITVQSQSGIKRNWIYHNTPSGIGSFDGNIPIRENVVDSNEVTGIHIYVGEYNQRPDLGTLNDPGKNVLFGNYEYDLAYLCPLEPLNAVGNYWRTIHTADIRSRIYYPPPPGGSIDFDPIAASDRVASVTYDSRCSTDVIVTGDLTVDPNVTLTIAPGKTFMFTTTPDCTTSTGHSINLCELLVNGTLNADGTVDQKINFNSYGEVHSPGDWYGIVLKPNGIANFANCLLQCAYNGIDAESSSTLFVDSSTIGMNQVCGINIFRSESAEIRNSKIKSNTYGIYCSNAAPVITNNELLDNKYGIFLKGSNGAVIAQNQINGSGPPSPILTLDGIFVYWTSDILLNENRIKDYGQTGIHCDYFTYARIYGDKILNCYNGILCSDFSDPYVRWCTIDTNKTGVFCEYNSYPDLGIWENVPEPDPGNNSILLDNSYWVVNANPEPRESIKAEMNWWGTDRPDTLRWKFLGLVDYDPWLRRPPEKGGGAQSASIIKPTPAFTLYAPRPNPAIRTVKIAYSIPNRCKTELIICDASGRVITKRTEESDAGSYEYLWNRKDQRGKEVPNGIYIIRLKAGDNLQTQKLTLAR